VVYRQQNLLYSDGESSLRKINIETGSDQLLVEVPDVYIWFFQLAAPVNKLLVMGFVDPGRVTFTYLYNLDNKELTEIKPAMTSSPNGQGLFKLLAPAARLFWRILPLVLPGYQ
jgi:hypothetical protein